MITNGKGKAPGAMMRCGEDSEGIGKSYLTPESSDMRQEFYPIMCQVLKALHTLRVVCPVFVGSTMARDLAATLARALLPSCVSKSNAKVALDCLAYI